MAVRSGSSLDRYPDGLPQGRRRDYCGSCQAVREDLHILVATAHLAPRWEAKRSGVEAEEGPT